MLLVEAAEDIARSLAKGLRHQGYAVDVAREGATGCELGELNDYDLVVLDLDLPDMNGLEVCRRLRALRPEAMILTLTVRGLPNDKIAALDAGADDCMVKPFHFGEFFARVHALLRRDRKEQGGIFEWGDIRLDPEARTVWVRGRKVNLTRKEFAILEYLMSRSGEVVSQEELIEHVWDSEANPFSGSARVHVHSLRRRLGHDPLSMPYIETLIGQGYRLNPGRYPHNPP